MVQVSDPQSVLDELTAPDRLAVVYAPRPAKAAWTALLALDERLARAALGAREPMLAQLRLAWWRDRFREPASSWPEGEPLLALLRAWDGERPALEALVDGWERTVGDPDAADRSALAHARIEAILALARLIGANDDPARVAAAARRWATGENAPAIPLGRALRPLTILAALAGEERRGLRGWLRVVRLGMLGR